MLASLVYWRGMSFFIARFNYMNVLVISVAVKGAHMSFFIV
jgi:hypothetical protein